MPVIDDIGVIPFSTKKQLTTIANDPPIGHYFASDTIDTLAGTLVACGWNLVSALKPVGRITYPLGFPTSTGGSGSVGCGGAWVTIETPIHTYKFSAYAPGQTPVGNPFVCTQFELGPTVLDSLTNLTLAIDFVSPYNASLALQPDGITYIISLQAKLGGTANNYDFIGADGRFGLGSGLVTGGGYILDSVGSSPYRVAITGEVGVADEKVMGFTFTLGPTGHKGDVAYVLGTNAVAQYSIVANPYSFAVFDGVSQNRSIAAFAPCIPVSEGFTGAYAVTVVGPGNLTSQIMWEGFTAPCSNSLDGPPATFGDNFDGPGVLCLRAEPGGLPLVTLDGRPVATAAYLFMGAGSLSSGHSPAIVGKLWDCLVITDFVAVGGTYQSGGRDFVCIASQSGSSGKSRGSLFFCVNDNGNPTAGDSGSGGGTDTGGSGDGGGDSPSVPAAPPGSGNGSKSGKCTSTGTPDNLTITWDSGDKFDASMIGQTITITLPFLAHPWVSAGGTGDADGTLPVIASITSPTVLKTTQGLNSSFAGASFTCP